MTSLFFLIPMTLILLGLAISIFFWATRNNQFEDLNAVASKIVLDDKLEYQLAIKSKTKSGDSPEITDPPSENSND